MRRPVGTLFTPAFVALTLSDLAYFTAAGALLGVTPFFVAGPLGSGPAAVGLAVGAFSITTLVLRPLVGRTVDRRGRRPVLIGGAAAFAVLVLAHLWVTDLGWLLVLRLLMGAAEALYFVAGFAALADLAPPSRTGEALSYNSLALYGGIAAGPALGQILVTAGGFGAAWVGIAVLLAAATALAARVPETLAPSTATTAPGGIVHRAAVTPGLGLFAGVAGVAGFLAFGALHVDRLGLSLWSVVPGLFGAVVVACRVLFARLPDQVSPVRLAVAALCTSALGLLVVASVPAAWAVLVGAVLLAVGTAFLTPAVFAAVFSTVPASQRGRAAGTTSVFIDLGLGSGPLLMGLVAARGGIALAFGAGAGLAAAGAALLLARGSAHSAAADPPPT